MRRIILLSFLIFGRRRARGIGQWGADQVGSGRPGEAPTYAGTDFIIARDGQIVALYLFFDRWTNG